MRGVVFRISKGYGATGQAPRGQGETRSVLLNGRAIVL